MTNQLQRTLAFVENAVADTSETVDKLNARLAALEATVGEMDRQLRMQLAGLARDLADQQKHSDAAADVPALITSQIRTIKSQIDQDLRAVVDEVSAQLTDLRANIVSLDTAQNTLRAQLGDNIDTHDAMQATLTDLRRAFEIQLGEAREGVRLQFEAQLQAMCDSMRQQLNDSHVAIQAQLAQTFQRELGEMRQGIARMAVDLQKFQSMRRVVFGHAC